MSTPRDPRFASVRVALQRGEHEAAAAACREILAVSPDDAIALTFLGVALRPHDAAAAEAALRRAATIDPKHGDAPFHLGNLLRERGRWQEAIAAYRAAVTLVPGHPGLQNNLGLALAGAGDVPGAEAMFRAVLMLDPGHRQALANLAHLLCRARRFDEAAPLAAKALAVTPGGTVDLLVDHGICQRELGDPAAAAASFRRALALAPDDATVLVNLATVEIDGGDYAAAEPHLARVVAAAPDDANALSLLAHCRQHLCAWAGLDTLHAKVRASVSADSGSATGAVNPFHLLAMPASPALQQAAARRWAATIVPGDLPSPAVLHARGDRLRIGYISSDFRDHAMAFLATEVWERHDRSRVTTFAYALPPADDSPTRERIVRAFDTFRDLHAATPAAMARTIRADDLDVLIDLNGYTTHERSEVLARRPAPLQVQWLGYLGTMGAPWIDGILTDRFVSPASHQTWFDERFLYLPDCYCPSDTRRAVGVVPDRAACGLPADGLVFCCFNNPYKLLPEVFAVWMRLLARHPGSVLWLAPTNTTAMRNLGAEAQRLGVDPGRLVFAPRVPPAAHLARHALADLYLDTFPYNAGTAANDALFMGVPVITCAGDTMASRVAGSQVQAVGVPELVTGDLATYEARIGELAGDRHRLAGLHETLAANRRHAPLFDMARFTRALEDCLGAAVGQR